MTDGDWQREWDVTAAAIGTDYGGGHVAVAADEVERGSIRRYCEVLELDCPLHLDDAAARSAGYAGIVAPISGVSQTWTREAHWRPGMPTRYPVLDPDAEVLREQLRFGGPPEPPTVLTFVTDLAIEYLAPVYVGDRLSRRGHRLAAVVPKETSIGRGAFLTYESEVWNQRGELVARSQNGGYHYNPFPGGDGAPSSSPQSAPAAADVASAGASEAGDFPRAPEWAAAPSIDWSQQRYFEDVTEGDEVPAVGFPITIARLVMEAGVNLDFSRVHHNAAAARRTGAPDMYANNVFVQGWWERTVREFIGLRGVIRSVGPFRMRIFNPVGETVTTRGVVRRCWREGDTGLVELEMRSEISRGVSVGPGPVVVSLPLRGS
ncbi:MAG: MaoC family dehydratase N-terminal domain-containing protein [Chloroflexi bacterium]|nr:MaoC family dehydratase N-terminal domain-containing protein [Chloroflexota bacterium]